MDELTRQLYNTLVELGGERGYVEGVSAREILELIGLDYNDSARSQTQRRIQALVGKGMLRIKRNQNDQRRNDYIITAKYKLAEAQEHVMTVRSLADITQEELNQMLKDAEGTPIKPEPKPVEHISDFERLFISQMGGVFKKAEKYDRLMEFLMTL